MESFFLNEMKILISFFFALVFPICLLSESNEFSSIAFYYLHNSIVKLIIGFSLKNVSSNFPLVQFDLYKWKLIISPEPITVLLVLRSMEIMNEIFVMEILLEMLRRMPSVKKAPEWMTATNRRLQWQSFKSPHLNSPRLFSMRKLQVSFHKCKHANHFPKTCVKQSHHLSFPERMLWPLRGNFQPKIVSKPCTLIKVLDW